MPNKRVMGRTLFNYVVLTYILNTRGMGQQWTRKLPDWSCSVSHVYWTSSAIRHFFDSGVVVALEEDMGVQAPA